LPDARPDAVSSFDCSFFLDVLKYVEYFGQLYQRCGAVTNVREDVHLKPPQISIRVRLRLVHRKFRMAFARNCFEEFFGIDRGLPCLAGVNALGQLFFRRFSRTSFKLTVG